MHGITPSPRAHFVGHQMILSELTVQDTNVSISPTGLAGMLFSLYCDINSIKYALRILHQIGRTSYIFFIRIM